MKKQSSFCHESSRDAVTVTQRELRPMAAVVSGGCSGKCGNHLPLLSKGDVHRAASADCYLRMVRFAAGDSVNGSYGDMLRPFGTLRSCVHGTKP